MLPSLFLSMGAALCATDVPSGASPSPVATVSPRPAALRMHAVALVNDPLSHGQVGDSLLSLNEAIQLHNGTIALTALSPAELARIGGGASDISEITIDFAVVPWITVERDLDEILSSPHGLTIEGLTGRPVIDFSASQVRYGFRAASDLCSWRNLVLHGGTFGIDLQQADASFGGTVIDNVLFEGESQFAFRGTGTTSGGVGRVLFDNCTIMGTPRGILFDDQVADRTSVFAVFHSEVAASLQGIEIRVGSGGSGTFQLESLWVTSPGTGIELTRFGLSDRPIRLIATHVDVAATTCIRLAGASGAPSELALRMLQLDGTGNGPALELWPLGAAWDGILEDSTMHGDCILQVGGGLAPFEVGNARCNGGNVHLGGQGGQELHAEFSAFRNCNVATTGAGTVRMLACSVEGGSVAGAAGAPLVADYCHFAATVGAAVSQSHPLAAPHLAWIHVSPRMPTLGGNLDLQVDLPPGLFSILAIGPLADMPLLLAAPLHIYLELSQALWLPGQQRGQATLTLPIPAMSDLLGTAWVCQAAVGADPGVPAPALQLPPGKAFTIR